MASTPPDVDLDSAGTEVSDFPLVAVPPSTPHSKLRESADVSTSDAFQLLDELLSEGKVGGDRVARLKAKYMELHSTLKTTRDHETALIQQAKEYTQQVAAQQAQLDKVDRILESGDTSEAIQLRRELLSHVNELSLSEDRYEKLMYDIYLLEEDRKEAEREYDRTLKPEDLEQKIQEINKAIEKLKDEISQRTQDSKQLLEAIEERQRLAGLAAKEMDEGLFKQVKLKDDFVQETTAAAAVAKELETLKLTKINVEDQKSRQEDLASQLDAQLDQIKEQQRLLQSEHEECNDLVDKQQRSNEALERDYQQFEKDYRLQCERRDACLGDKATLDINFQHASVEFKLQLETHSRCCREKERELKHVKRAELQLKNARETLEQTRAAYVRLKTEVEEFTKNAEIRSQKQHEVKDEVSMLRRQAALLENLSSTEKAALDDALHHEHILSEFLKDVKEVTRNNNRVITLKTIERDQKARETHRANSRLRVIYDDVKTKENVIEESRKRNREIEGRLKQYAEMYDVLKAERNKCVTHIQTTTQKAGEMHEKIKILQNEIEILQASIASKERLTAKSHLKVTQSVMLRDSIKNELCKQQRVLEEYHSRTKRQVKNIENLNRIINAAEEQMVQLRKRYEQSVQERNDRGVQLIERNEEVCIFYEKLNLQDTMMRSGDIEMQGKSEEIRFMTMEISDLKREIDVLRSAVPNKRGTEDGLTTVQIQLEQCKERMEELEAQLQSPSAQNTRLLEGVDMSLEDAERKIEELEVRLADKEELLLEKELVLEEVSRLCERARKKAESGKQDTLTLAKKVNDFQSQIKLTTRKMMAIVSELSMNQANVLKLEQSAKEKEANLEICKLRMECGECPSDEVEREWKKQESTMQTKETDKKQQREAGEDAQQYELASGVFTTAEPRPNAYIPEGDGELPLPKPYGAHAPFKPSEPGSSMRHIKKPVQKPIEL